MYPCEPLDGRPAPDRTEIFYKPVSALQHPGDPIVIPPEATNVRRRSYLRPAAPLGPAIVTGLDYGSRWATLVPGDVIYTGWK